MRHPFGSNSAPHNLSTTEPPEVAELLRELRAFDTPLDAPDAFLADLRRQLQARAAILAADADQLRVPTHTTSVSEQGLDRPRNSQMPPVASLAAMPVYVAEQRQRRIRQAIELAAALLIFAALGATLIAVFGSHGNQPATGATPPAVAQPALPSAPDGQLITLEQALNIARAFINDPAADLLGTRSDTSFEPLYHFQTRVAGLTKPDTVNVDADTGEVMAVQFPSRTTLTLAPAPISQAAAQRLAEAFARTHFAAFDTLTAYPANVGSVFANFSSDTIASFAWQLQASGSGAWLPTLVKVDVNLQTSQIYGYTGGHRRYDGPTMPTVARADAISAVMRVLQGDPAYATASIVSVDLYAWPSQLAWMFNVKTSAGVAYDVEVNALTGEVVGPEVGQFVGPYGNP